MRTLLVLRFNYGPTSFSTARSHSSASGDAELCPPSQQTARITLEPTPVPLRPTTILCLTTIKAPLSFAFPLACYLARSLHTAQRYPSGSIQYP